MEHSLLGKSGLKVSRLGLGAARHGYFADITSALDGKADGELLADTGSGRSAGRRPSS